MESMEEQEQEDVKRFCPLCSTASHNVPLMKMAGDYTCARKECPYTAKFWSYISFTGLLPEMVKKQNQFPEFVKMAQMLDVPIPPEKSPENPQTVNILAEKSPDISTEKTASPPPELNVISTPEQSDKTSSYHGSPSTSSVPPKKRLAIQSYVDAGNETVAVAAKSNTPSPNEKTKRKSKEVGSCSSPKQAKKLDSKSPTPDLLNSLINDYKKFVFITCRPNLTWLNSSLALLMFSGSIYRYFKVNPNLKLQLAKSYQKYNAILKMANKDSFKHYLLLDEKLDHMRADVLAFFRRGPHGSDIDSITPLISISAMLKENRDLVDLFEITHSWKTFCSNCSPNVGSPTMKTIVSFQHLEEDFNMLEPITSSLCKKCLKGDEKRHMIYESLPGSFIFHFENGIPTNDIVKYDFDFDGHSYKVKGFILFISKNFKNRFVTWIRDLKSNSWLSCDEPKMSFYMISSELPDFKKSEVYMIMWERVTPVTACRKPRRLPTPAPDLSDNELIIDLQSNGNSIHDDMASHESSEMSRNSSFTNQKQSSSTRKTKMSPPDSAHSIKLPDFKTSGYNLKLTPELGNKNYSRKGLPQVRLENIFPSLKFCNTIVEGPVEKVEDLDESSYTEFVEPDGTKIQTLKASVNMTVPVSPSIVTGVQSRVHSESLPCNEIASLTSKLRTIDCSPNLGDSISQTVAESSVNLSLETCEDNISKKRKKKSKDKSPQKKDGKKNKKSKKEKSEKSKRSRSKQKIEEQASSHQVFSAPNENTLLHKSSKSYIKRQNPKTPVIQGVILSSKQPATTTDDSVTTLGPNLNILTNTDASSNSTSPIEKLIYPVRSSIRYSPLKKAATTTLRKKAQDKSSGRNNSAYNLRRQPKPSDIGKVNNPCEVSDWVVPSCGEEYSKEESPSPKKVIQPQSSGNKAPTIKVLPVKATAIVTTQKTLVTSPKKPMSPNIVFTTLPPPVSQTPILLQNSPLLHSSEQGASVLLLSKPAPPSPYYVCKQVSASAPKMDFPKASTTISNTPPKELILLTSSQGPGRVLIPSPIITKPQQVGRIPVTFSPLLQNSPPTFTSITRSPTVTMTSILPSFPIGNIATTLASSVIKTPSVLPNSNISKPPVTISNVMTLCTEGTVSKPPKVPKGTKKKSTQSVPKKTVTESPSILRAQLVRSSPLSANNIADVNSLSIISTSKSKNSVKESYSSMSKNSETSSSSKKDIMKFPQLSKAPSKQAANQIKIGNLNQPIESLRDSSLDEIVDRINSVTSPEAQKKNSPTIKCPGAKSLPFRNSFKVDDIAKELREKQTKNSSGFLSPVSLSSPNLVNSSPVITKVQLPTPNNNNTSTNGNTHSPDKGKDNASTNVQDTSIKMKVVGTSKSIIKPNNASKDGNVTTSPIITPSPKISLLQQMAQGGRLMSNKLKMDFRGLMTVSHTINAALNKN